MTAEQVRAGSVREKDVYEPASLVHMPVRSVRYIRVPAHQPLLLKRRV